MGTVISATGVAHATFGAKGHRAITLEERACVAAIDAAGITADDIDLLLNTGMYRDGHLGEPAFAALLQDDLDMNRGHPPTAGQHGSFSFDILDGVRGPLTAFQMADVLLRAGTIRRALIVGGDTNPDHTPDFPFASSGAAAVLSWDPDRPGLIAHDSRTFGASGDALVTSVIWQPTHHRSPFGHGGHNTLVIERSPHYYDAALAALSETLGEFVGRHGIALDEEDAIVIAGLEGRPGMSERLAAAIGADGCAVVAAEADAHGRTLHTASLLSALHTAEGAHLLTSTRHVVLAAVGAGLSVALALYRPHP